MTDIFDRLNDDQLAAVTETEGYVRIIAGAGSGKTRTLTHRYAYLVKAAGIHPSNVLCVTFTNKAAGEMKRRVRELVGDGYDNSLITTYHGFCVRVLREDIHRLFYPKSFTILDEADQRRILSEIYTEMEIKLDRATFEKILDAVHRLKSDEGYVSAMVNGDLSALTVPPASPVSPTTPLESAVVRRYLEKQRKLFGLDFDDLVSFTFAVFAAFPEVREKWAERLYYIQVDEFQDSSKRELRLIRSLCAAHGNLFVVGDPDQNIYEWRGADMSILVDFDKLFPGCETILLNRNYRSTGNILRAANTLIAHNKNRIPKELYTADAAGADVVHLHAKTEADEGKWITDEILRLTREEGIRLRDIAVLYRAGFLSRFVEQALMQAGIDYELYGSVRFYERMEIRDALAYLRLLLTDDDESLLRIVNTPRRSFGKAKVDALRSIAADEGTSLYETLKTYRSDPLFARSGIGSFVGMIEELRGKANTTPASELLKEVLDRSGYEKYIRENGSMERLDNLAELKRSVWEREQSWGEFYPLSAYLQEVALEGDREDDENADRVKLMTIHASKGLEFPVCFVCGFTEGIFPSSRTLEERKEAGLEEERRLCFVAMTRAMKRLYLTESEGTGSDRASKRPSRFLTDIGEENYTRIGVIPKELSEAGGAAPETAGAAGEKSVGAVVNHPIFGRGVVSEIDRAKGIYYILFEKTGSRRPVSMDYDFDAWRAQIDRVQNPPAPPAETEKPPEETRTPESGVPVDTVGSEPDAPQMRMPIPQTATAEIPASAKNEPVRAEPKKKAKKPPAGAEDQIAMNLTGPDAGSGKPAGELPRKYRDEPWARAEAGEENLWKRDDVPHEGWVCADVIDLGEPVGVCRMCGHQIIRYVHVMRHPAYHRTVGAGCVCAGRMEGDPEAARARETAFKNRQARRETFLKTPLKRSRGGHEYLKYKGEIVTLLEDRYKPGYYKSVLRGKYSPPFPAKEEALADAFDTLDPWEIT